ncbi:alpha/beta hydrolase [Sulfurimonas sp.]|uniref:RBBP9/YdeN family alpha/beta hydrolase n=1 Tax=Sulfurimonas sp. TaxID=2022749 RepID=UPI00261A9A7A|nr:alpha/beta hydrolase [Sulfurimonas sp.]MCW8896201.1 alpha/beta hydrolase [Sulfurimonas sp.]MCW9067222.1 alpha/beta hydrolase [Sulfurimonas sp.]
MNKKILILHGWGGSNFPHWQSWLAGEIAKDYGKVSFLRLNDFDFPNKSEWKHQLIKELEDFKPDIVICHSLANILWFHICNDTILTEVEKLYLVVPPSLKCDIPELESFYPCEIPTNLYAKEALLISSTDDPYMTQDEVKALQNELNIPMKVLEGAGHINADSGFGEWPWMLEEISK